MTNQQNFILRVLTKLDEDIIDKSTQQRFELLNRQKKKPPHHRGWIFGAAMAACLCLIFSTVMILLMPGETSIRQVPVYEGMTVSTMVPGTRERLNTEASASFASLSAPRPSLASLSQLTSEEATAEDDTDDVTQAPVTENAPPTVSGSETLYYAKPHQDIYITIHVNNPDNFEILSFTLNGKVYSSYMFEDGSDMENLILKYNVGDAEGIVEYTIDAIKYVDGTEIKDALMEGDRTVKVGVYTEKQPHVTVSNELAGINKITFTVAPTDEMNLMAISGGRVTARLTDGENVLSEKEISSSETVEIIFDGLSADTTYRYEIIAEYDALDGQGYASHLLYEKEFRTEKFVAFDGISTTQDAVFFNLVWNDKIDGADILALELYQGDTMVRELPVTSMKAADLLSDTEYTLVVSYRNSGAVETVKATFTTQAKAVPQLTVTPGEATHTSVGFDVSLTDPDGVGRVTMIELLHGTDAPVVADDLNVRRFDGLLSDNEYTVQVTVVYDLNDGTGEHTITKTVDVKTLAKTTPTLAVTASTVSQSAVSFSVAYTDVDKAGRVTMIELLHGTDAPVVADDLNVRRFDGLLSDNEYTVRVTYVYDLNDGTGEHVANKILQVKTAAKAKPVFTFSNFNAATDAISGTYTVLDVDKVLKDYSVALYQGNTQVADTKDKKFSFAGLKDYTDYTVKITYRYDLSNGNGVVQDVAQKSIKTLPIVDVTSVMVRNTSAVSEGDTIYLQGNLNNRHQGKVSSVVINGRTYPVTNSSTATSFYVEIINDGQFTGGDTTLTVEKVNISLGGILYETIPDQPCSASVFINGILEMLSINYVNSKYEPVDTWIPGEDAYLMFTLSNPTDYNILSLEVTVSPLIFIDDMVIGNNYSGFIDGSMLIKLDADHYLYPLTFEGQPVYIYNENGEIIFGGLTHSGINTADWFSVSYGNDYLQKTVYPTENTTPTTTCCVPVSNEVKYISTPDDLKDVDDWYLYELTNDIDLAGIEWRSVPFRGILDGKGYAIRNMSYVGGVTDEYMGIGLFGVSTGVIRNLDIENCFFIVNTDNNINYGAISANHEVYLSLSNCSVDADSTVSLKGAGVNAGGLANYANTVKNCVNASSISITTTSGHARGGGICANARYVKGCTNYGSITIATEASDGSYVCGGGMVGRTNARDVIVGCANHGDITLDASRFVTLYNAGGIAGLSEAGTISDCINTGHIFSHFWAGGITNTKGDDCLIQNCINTGIVETSSRSSGGIIGDTDGYGLSVVKGCVNVGTLITAKSTAEKFGVAPLFIVVENCYATTLYRSKGSTVTNTKLNTKSFWTNTLGWDEAIWNFDDLDFENGKYPTLRKN